MTTVEGTHAIRQISIGSFRFAVCSISQHFSQIKPGKKKTIFLPFPMLMQFPNHAICLIMILLLFHLPVRAVSSSNRKIHRYYIIMCVRRIYIYIYTYTGCSVCYAANEPNTIFCPSLKYYKV